MMPGGQDAPAPAPAGTGGADPSMEDILASIRKILNEDEAPADPTKHNAAADVLDLTEDMLVAPANPTPAPAPEPPITAAPVPADPVIAAPMAEPEPPAAVAQPPAPPPPAPPAEPTPAQDVSEPSMAEAATLEAPPPAADVAPPATTLVAPAVAAAAAASLGSLLRTVAAERDAAVHRAGPSIEDIVRQEMRPMLKEWLDLHLAPLVERLVRAEIERVVGRGGT